MVTAVLSVLSVCRAHERGSDAYLRCVVRTSSGAVYHWVGSCRMGAVVDTALRVLAVRGLRLADASVMPSPPSGNTMAATIMVAERAADLIKQDHGLLQPRA